MRDYIELEGASKYKFRVIHEGYDKSYTKAGMTTQRTLTGKIDIQVVPLVRRWAYTLMVYDTDPVGGTYGTIDDLEGLYERNTPSTITLTLYDHNYDDTSTTHDVIMTGNFSRKPITPMLGSACTVYRVNVVLEATEAS